VCFTFQYAFHFWYNLTLKNTMAIQPINSVKIQEFISVSLIGGNSPHEGNVIALNPVTGLRGPICDVNWSIKEVKKVATIKQKIKTEPTLRNKIPQ